MERRAVSGGFGAARNAVWLTNQDTQEVCHEFMKEIIPKKSDYRSLN
jgi:hypothetical protein